jgi:tetratricopeptide (TPR) repeat protein
LGNNEVEELDVMLPTPSANPTPNNGLPMDDALLGRRLFLVLGAIALVYAFLAGLATVGDPDLGWHLATGRWVAQHHHVFSTDVFSYTVPGAPAVYPPGGGLILYGLYLLGGFSLLSWLGALACLATVALLLRRGSAVTAAIAIVAVPFIAYRTVPRSELFAVVLFAAYLSLLWENYQTGRAPLWWLPLLMVVWVNVHVSFFSGLGLLVGFAGLEILELPFAGSRRDELLQRLKRETPWFLASAAATLINPWGWRLYPAILQFTKSVHARYINEWASVHWNWADALTSFSPRNTSDMFHVLCLITVLAMIAAVLQYRAGAAILLVGAAYEASRHVRMLALASCIVVVVAGSVLSSAMPWIRSRIANARTRSMLATAAVAILAALAIVRSADLITNYHYLAERNLSTFGAGLSGWFPRRGAEFIQDHQLPGEVLNTYNEGGYILWALGPQRRDYIDGREVPFGPALAQHGGELLSTPLDSTGWRQEADKYGINTIIFPLTLDEISLGRLKSDCNSQEWRPVYLDEVSIVLVRRTPQNADLIKRFEIDCATAPVPRERLPQTAASFDQWIDAARVLSALGRNSEALAAADKAMAIFPDNAHARWCRGQILLAMQRHSEAEQDWQRALALAPREVTPWGSLVDFQAAVWSSLAELYHQQERFPDAMHALQAVIRLSTDPSTKVQAMANLAALELATGQSAEAEKEWMAALSLDPQDPLIWLSLADLYQADGRLPQAVHAMLQSVRLSSDPAAKSQGLVKVARLYLKSRQPKDALLALDAAASTAPPELLAATAGRSFSFDLAQTRAAAWLASGDLKQATAFEEQAVQLDPNAAEAWSHLANLYQREGRVADQQQAEKRVTTLRKDSPAENR